MKKIVLSIILSIIMLNLCSCSKSTEVKEVEKLISNIGNVSLGSADQIAEAEEAYNSLSEEEKKHVNNYDALLEAKSKYDSLGIKLTVDNFEEYLNFSCSKTLTNAIDYGQVMGVGKSIGQSVYRAIEPKISVKGKSSNYDYNDVVITVNITGHYVPYSQDIMKKINRGDLTLKDYYKNNMKPIDVTLNIETDIIGSGSNSTIINIPDNFWVMSESVNISYEVINVTGIMTK